MGLETIESNKTYLTIVRGTLTQKVDENTPNAKLRKYEKSDGSEGEKWELQYKSVSGVINSLDFKDSDFGEQFVIELKDVDETYSLQFPVDSKYFSDFGKKVSNIHLDMEIVLRPFDFEPEGKRRTGISIMQEGVKIENYFWDNDNKKVLHGFPVPENKGEGFDNDDWKVYFIDVKKFLKKHVQGIVLPESYTPPFEPADDINEEDPDDLPF